MARLFHSFFAIAALLLAIVAVPAQAQQCGSGALTGERVALLIGNDRYDDSRWSPLTNAGNDLVLVCESLRGAGYGVRLIRDANAAELRATLDRFANEASGARSVLIYYAGHGFEYAGRNYIVPRDAPGTTSGATVERDFLSLEALAITAVPTSAFSVIFVDACRTAEPVVTLTGGDNGTQRVAPVGLLGIDQGAVFYSTAKGRPALDQAPPGSPVSPFAAAVVRHLETPGIELSDFFRVVSRDVYRSTMGLDNGPQQPFHYGSWFEDFYLVAPQAIRLASRGPVRAAANPVARRPWSGNGGPPPSPSPAQPGSPSASAGASPPGSGDTDVGFVRPDVRGAAAPAAIDPTRRRPSGLSGRAPSALSMARLSNEDEPLLVAELLTQVTADDLHIEAELNNPAAQHILGYMYHFGVGVRRDLQQAQRWLIRSAFANYPPGQLELGYYLLENNPTPAARVRAEELYRAAAAAGYAKAKTHLAERISSGQFGPPDHAEARRLYGEAAEAGHVAAIYALTRFPELRTDMMARLRRVAAAGNPDGNNWVCEAEFGESRLASVIDDCLIAARAGYAGARAIVARAYADGIGVTTDRREAQFWARLARSQPELGNRAALIVDISSE